MFMTMERCLVFVKPGNDLGLATEVFGFIDEKLSEDFRRTVPLHIHGVKREVIERHYSHIRNIPQYKPTIESFVKGEVFVTVYIGPEICRRIGVIRGLQIVKKHHQIQ